jgi:hypothetical protein
MANITYICDISHITLVGGPRQIKVSVRRSKSIEWASHVTSQLTHSSERNMGSTLSSFDSALGASPLGCYQNCFGYNPYRAHYCVLTNTSHTHLFTISYS